MKSITPYLALSSLVTFALTTQAWADAAPGCDVQAHDASPLMIVMMFAVAGIAVLVGRRNQDHNEHS